MRRSAFAPTSSVWVMIKPGSSCTRRSRDLMVSWMVVGGWRYCLRHLHKDLPLPSANHFPSLPRHPDGSALGQRRSLGQTYSPAFGKACRPTPAPARTSSLPFCLFKAVCGSEPEAKTSPLRVVLGLRSHPHQTTVGRYFTLFPVEFYPLIAWKNRCSIHDGVEFNETVADARELDLVARGLLWACKKLNDSGKPLAGLRSRDGEVRRHETPRRAESPRGDANGPDRAKYQFPKPNRTSHEPSDMRR